MELEILKKILREFLVREPEKASELIEFIKDTVRTADYNVLREKILAYREANILSKAFARKLYGASSPLEMRRIIEKYRKRMMWEGDEKKVELCDWLLKQPFAELKKVIKEEVL